MCWEVVSCWIESHPGLASWVQAVGSITAVGIAMIAPIWHQKSQETRLMMGRARALRDLLVILDDCVSILLGALFARSTAIKGLRERFENYPMLGEAEKLRSVADALVKFDAGLVPSELTKHIVRCRALAMYCVRVESEYVSCKSSGATNINPQAVERFFVDEKVVAYLNLSPGSIKEAIDAIDNIKP